MLVFLLKKVAYYFVHSYLDGNTTGRTDLLSVDPIYNRNISHHTIRLLASCSLVSLARSSRSSAGSVLHYLSPEEHVLKGTSDLTDTQSASHTA